LVGDFVGALRAFGEDIVDVILVALNFLPYPSAKNISSFQQKIENFAAKLPEFSLKSLHIHD
jgi:hypothetical protein